MLALLTLDGQLKLVDMSTLVVTDAPDELQSLHGEPVRCSLLCHASCSASRQTCRKHQLLLMHGRSVILSTQRCPDHLQCLHNENATRCMWTAAPFPHLLSALAWVVHLKSQPFQAGQYAPLCCDCMSRQESLTSQHMCNHWSCMPAGIALGSGAGPDSSTSGSLLMLGCLDEGAPLSSYPRWGVFHNTE